MTKERGESNGSSQSPEHQPSPGIPPASVCSAIGENRTEAIDGFNEDGNSQSKDSVGAELSQMGVGSSEIAPMDVDDDDDEPDAFEALSSARQSRPPKSKKRKRPRMKISLQTTSIQGEEEEKTDPALSTDTRRCFFVNRFSRPVLPPSNSLSALVVWEDGQHEHSYIDDETMMVQQQEDDETLLEESLAFFHETHEDQDPEVVAFRKAQTLERLEKELAELEALDEKKRNEITSIVQRQYKEKSESAQRKMQRLGQHHEADQKRLLSSLQQNYNARITNTSEKIRARFKAIQGAHQEEQQKLVRQHHSQVRQRGIAEPMASAQLQEFQKRLKHRQASQLAELKNKADQAKKKVEHECKQEREAKLAVLARRKDEIKASINEMFDRLKQNSQKLLHSYMKRHAHIMAQRKADLARQIRQIKGIEEEAPADDNGGKVRGEIALPDKDHLDSAWAREVVQGNFPVVTDTNQPRGKEEFRAPEPCSSHETVTRSDASMRLKNRKNIFGQIQKQLSVEIHNEGLWIGVYHDSASKTAAESSSSSKKKQDEEKSASTSKPPPDSEFLPWGWKARKVLQSIVCGEIPEGYGEDKFTWGEKNDIIAVQGGHIRAVVTDLRTGETTASTQRAAALRAQEEQSIMELEAKVAKLGDLLVVAERDVTKSQASEKECAQNVEKAGKDVQKAKTQHQQFLTKYAKYFVDGQVVSENPSDRQKLIDANNRIKTTVTRYTEKEKLAQKALADAKATTAKLQATIKHTQKSTATAGALLKKRKAMFQEIKGGGSKGGRIRLSEAAGAERASSRVADTVAAFHKAAEQRRQELALKRNASSSTSSKWYKDVEAIPDALQKSLRHKMHRRRQPVVLRPVMAFMPHEIRQREKKRHKEASVETNEAKKEKAAEEAAVLAEQLFLTSVYPLSKELPVVPQASTHEPWAEPGSYVDLSVPDDPRFGKGILPRARAFPVLEKATAEKLSAPGQQALLCMPHEHYKALSAPLSAVGQAVSLAETTPVMTSAKLADGDPLNISKAAMETGYTFATKSSRHPSTTARRKSAADAAAAAAAAAEAKAKTENSDTKRSQPGLKASASRDSTSSTSSRRQSKSERPTAASKARRASSSKAVPPVSSGAGGDHQLTPQNKKVKLSPSDKPTAAQLQHQAAQSAAYMQQQTPPSLASASRGMATIDPSAFPPQPAYLKQQGLPTSPQLPQHQAMVATQMMPPQPPPYSAATSPQQAAAYQQQQQLQMRMIQQPRGTPVGAPYSPVAGGHLSYFGQPLAQPAAIQRAPYAPTPTARPTSASSRRPTSSSQPR